VIELKIEPAWAPNVYVSVLVLRGRLRDVPWIRSSPGAGSRPGLGARLPVRGPREYQAPTAMVDLAKPGFKLGVAALQVGPARTSCR
jgi:alpha-2-macroglobulin